MAEYKDIPDIIILPIGILLVCYVLISLFFTYKYRSGLYVEQKQVIRIESSDEVEKQRLKVEKKKAKAEVKKAKKQVKNNR